MSGRARKLLQALILTFFPLSAHAIDVERFELLKGIHYYQVGAGAAHLQTNNAYRFSASVHATAVGDVLAVSVVTSRGNGVDLLPDRDGDPFRIREKFDEFAQFDTIYPNGPYSLTIHGRTDGERTMNFDISGNFYPAAPVLNEYSRAQSLPYNQYNQISWQPFQGGTASDFIQVQIEDLDGNNVWETPDYGEDGALSGLATGALMPPGVLRAGNVYVGTLRFVKVLQSGSRLYPGLRGTVGYFSRTEFTVRAVATGLIPTTDRVQLWKVNRYEQVGDTSPFLQPRAWEFVAEVDSVAPGQISGVGLTLPGGNEVETIPDSSATEFEFSDDNLLTPESFAAAYPDGAYTFSIGHPTGLSDTLAVNLPNLEFPPAPKLLNSASFENHISDENLVVSWSPWTNAASQLDYVRVELLDEGDKTFDTPSFASLKHLPASATTVTISAANFTPGHSYRLQITFNRVGINDSRTLPGAIVFGGYATRTKLDFRTQPPDVIQFGVTESRSFRQYGEGLFEANPTNAFLFQATATPATAGVLLAANIAVPNGPTLSLAADEITAAFSLTVAEGFAGSLAEHYPAGAYRFNFSALHDGARTSTVTLASTELPPIPEIIGFTNLQTIRARADLEIRWLKWPNADPKTDSVDFTLTDALGVDVNLGATGLDARSNVVAIFRDTLTDNRSYLGRLRFIRHQTAEQPSYPGARGRASLISETTFYISTLGTNSSSSPFAMNSVVLNGSRQLQFRVSNPLPGRAYRIYKSEDLVNWTPFQTNAVSGAALFVTIPLNFPRAFFKMALLP